MTHKTMFLYQYLLLRNSFCSIVACSRQYYIQSEVIIFVAKAYFDSPSSTFKHHVLTTIIMTSRMSNMVTWRPSWCFSPFRYSWTPRSISRLLPPNMASTSAKTSCTSNWARASDLRWKLVQDHPSYSLIGRIEIPTPSLSAELLSNTPQKLEFQQVSFEHN